jgi:hypothetical protein
MSDSSTEFEAFSDLPATLQVEAIREGEERLRAQLDVANAADARALNLTAMLIAAITASLGGGVTFLTRDPPDYFAALLGFGFGVLLSRAATTASAALAPDIFRLPGNSPAHWLPSEWDTSGSERIVTDRARREQAEALANAIAKNGAQADERAECVKEALRQVREAVTAAAIVAFGLTIFRLAGMNVGTG